MKRIALVLLLMLFAGLLALQRMGDSNAAPIPTPQPGSTTPTPELPPDSIGDTSNARERRAAPMTGPDEPATAGRTGNLVIAVRHATASGSAAAGAGVELLLQPASILDPWTECRHDRTDDRGELHVQLPTGDWRVTAGTGASTTTTIAADRTQRVELQLAAGFTVQGSVTDPQGNPVAEATVLAGPSAERLLALATTGADGTFTLAGLQGFAVVAARHPYHAPSAIQMANARAGEVVPMRFLLTATAGRVLGTVVDANGVPIGDAQVSIAPQLRGQPQQDFLVLTAADGTFASPPLPAGLVRVRARAKGHGPVGELGELRAGVATRLRLQLPAPATVTGQARHADGSPAAGAEIWSGTRAGFESRNTRSQADGSYVLTDLPAGTVALRARAGGAAADTRIELVAGGRCRWDFEFEDGDPARTVAGRVLDHRGQPLAGWRVTARDRGASGRNVGRFSDDDGAFVLRGLAAGSTLLLQARPGTSEPLAFAAATLDGVPVGTRDVVLTVPDARLATGRVVGTIVDATGRGRPARIDLWHEATRASASYRAGDDGRFELTGIPTGAVQLRWEHPDHPVLDLDRATVPAGGTLDLGMLAFAPGAIVLGTLVGPNGTPPASATLRLLDAKGQEAATADQTGDSFRLPPVAPGDYDLQVQANGCAPVKLPLTLLAGDQRQVRIELRIGLPRRIRVRAPAGADCGAWVGLFVGDGEQVWRAGLPLRDGTAEFLVFMPAGEFRVVARGQRGWQVEGTAPFAPTEPAPLELELQKPH